MANIKKNKGKTKNTKSKATTTKTTKKQPQTRSSRHVAPATHKVKVRKVRFGRILLVLTILFLLVYLVMQVFSFPIKNIYIAGNDFLSDQEIIELAHIEDYPSMFKYTKSEIEGNLEKNTYIKEAKVKKKNLKEIHITIEENKPLFYDSSKEKTILLDRTEVESDLNAPILLNYVPDTIYESFIDKLSLVDNNIMYKISEIKYDPNDVDDERFLLTMNDGNYVYLTLYKFEKINNYVDIIKEVLTKYKKEKGTLFLDEGEYFEVFKN